MSQNKVYDHLCVLLDIQGSFLMVVGIISLFNQAIIFKVWVLLYMHLVERLFYDTF